MINLQTITNVSDCVPLYLPHSLYLKPVARLSISVGLPPNKMGKSISNFDIMDKLTKALAPDKFLVLKVSKSTLDVIRLEAELEEPSRLQSALGRLDGMSFKVNAFTEPFKVRAKETKDEFPTRHDWDIFFRDAHYMDEMKAGERPDTIHLANLPIRWFCPRHMENDENVKPSESIFKRIFEKFGTVRAVDIPVCDVFREKMSSDVNGMKVHNFDQDLFFEGYVQFEEYIGFVRAMDEFRGMKLVRKFVDKTQAVNIIVHFDKRKHLSDASVLRRERIRKGLLAKVKAREDEEDRRKKKEQEKVERERKLAEELKLKELERQREREEKRKKKHLKKLHEKGQIEISRKIRMEEKKLLIVQRKLESIRVLEALFERLKMKDIQEKGKPITHMTIDLRQRLVDKYKSATEKLLDEQKKKLEAEKLQTGLSGLLKQRRAENDHSDGNSANGNAKLNGKKKKKAENETSESSTSSSDEGEEEKKPEVDAKVGQPFNPFKDVYTPEAAAELMKMSMLSYGVFPGMPMYRPSFPPPHSMRGYVPRGRGGSMRGPRRGGFNYQGSSGYSSYNYYNNYRNGGGTSNERYDNDYYKPSRSYSRSRSRKRSRSRSRSSSRSRSDSRSRSRTRSRHRRYSRSRRSRHRSNTRSHSRSRSRYRSRSHRSRTKERSRSRSRLQSKERENRPRTRSRSPSNSKSHPKRARTTSKERSTRDRSNSRSRSRIRRSRSKVISPSKPKSETHRSRSKSKSSKPPTSNHGRSKSRSQPKEKDPRSRSKDRARSRSKSNQRSKSRKHHSHSNSVTKSKSHKIKSKSRSPTKDKSSSRRSSKKLVSTRRSRSQTSWSRSPTPSRRSWSKNAES